MRRRRRAPNRTWLRSSALTFGFSLVVAAGVADHGWALPVAVLGVALVGHGMLHFLFPREMHFTIATATGLGLYASFFAVLGRGAFPAAGPVALVIGFALPVAAFLASLWLRRDRLAALAEQPATPNADHFPGILRWLGGLAVVGSLSFSLPINRLDVTGQSVALVAAMAVIGALVALAARDVVRLLTGVAVILEEMAGRAGHLLVPVVAFLIFYALLVIGFAATYRIADAMSLHSLFIGATGVAARLSFSDALYFSVVTLSTVGYGDIRPSDDGIRLLAAVQMVSGQLLLLFGFAEVMRSRGAQVPGPPEQDGPP